MFLSLSKFITNRLLSILSDHSDWRCSLFKIRNKYMKKFHAHIYFEAVQKTKALELAQLAEKSELFSLVFFQERAVGPHSTGMIEAHFNETKLTAIINWMNRHRGAFSVLIHEDSDDDIKDHTDGSQWLGKELPLDFSFFTLIDRQPDLRIHPKSSSNKYKV